MPDLVILDIRLPDIDGYEVARRLRNNRRMEEIPIIFLTEKRERATGYRAWSWAQMITSPSPSIFRSCTCGCAMPAALAPGHADQPDHRAARRPPGG